MTIDFPPPSNWQDFERLCLAISRRHFACPEAVIYGRTGQRQHGIDIAIPDRDGERPIGVQCKLHEEHRVLQQSEVVKEIKRAETFPSGLSHLYVFTTSKKDARLQDWSFQESQDRVASGSFRLIHQVSLSEPVLATMKNSPQLKLPFQRLRRSYLIQQLSQRSSSWMHFHC